MSENEEQAQLDDFVGLFRRLVHQVLRDVPKRESPIRARVENHLGEDPLALPIVGQSWKQWDHVNLQRALDAYTAAPDVEIELLGISAQHKRHMQLSLSDLLQGDGPMGGGFSLGPVDYVKLASGPGETLSCVEFGLFLVRTAEGPLVALVHPAEDHGMGASAVIVEVMAHDEAYVDAFHERLRALARELNVFRGQVLSLGSAENIFESTGSALQFHERAPLARDALVMPDGALERIERHTIGIAEMGDALRASGRHLKRGVLLHGPPGTGKTLTARYLIARLEHHTVLLLTGGGLGMVGAAVEVARALQPSVVILEDCDLIAEERTFPGAHNPVLFELLNAMDGVGDDADLLFVLTTNRPDLLEPAFAARPGRVDLAVEIPLPDADCRRRLIDRYFEGVDAELTDITAIVERTDGITASFVKELVRASTVRAFESGGDAAVVRDEHVAAALDEMLDEGGVLTARLLGGAADRPPPSTFASMGWMPGAAPFMPPGMMRHGTSVGHVGFVTETSYELHDEYEEFDDD